MRISKLSYTVQADVNSDFVIKLQNFLLTLKLFIFDFDALTNTYTYKVNFNNYMESHFGGSDVLFHLRDEINNITKVILSVQVLESNQYIISYFNIGKEIELEDSKKINKVGGYSDSMMFYHKILSNGDALRHELKSLKKITEFVTAQAPTVTTIINNIDLGFKYFDEKAYGTAREIFKNSTLSQLIENDGSHLTYEMCKANVDKNVYTIPTVKYKATIADSQKIVDLYHTKKDLPLQKISYMTESEILSALSHIIRLKLKSNKKQVVIKVDAINGYHVVADASCRKSWVAPINTKDGLVLTFEPLFKPDTNYASLSTIKEKYDLKFYKCEGTITSTEYKKTKDKKGITVSAEMRIYTDYGKGTKKLPVTYTKKYDRDTLNAKTQYFAAIHINNFTKDGGTYSLSELDDVASYLSRIAANYIVGNYKNTYYEEHNPVSMIPLVIHDELQDDIKNILKIKDLGVGGYSFMNNFCIKPNDMLWELKKVI